jgi:putative DNA primase/helicase
MNKITDLANGQWPAILGALGGLSGDQLTNKHQPCPLCGGEDRYRFDDQDGSGSWFCNQCGGKDGRGGAGNGMDLLLRITGWNFKDAADRIEQHLGIAPSVKPGQSIGNPPTCGAEQFWRYSPTFLVCRFPGKKIRPLWWSGSRWEWKAPPAPRPLLNLDQLRVRTGTVLIVEGEKAADAAAKLYPKAVATTWPSGCKAINQADWSPLKGRRVILWPDADQVGQDAMDKLAQKLLRLSVDRVQMVIPPPDAPEGWDLANAAWTTNEALAYLKANLSAPLELDPEQPELLAEPEPDDAESDQWPFKCLGYDRGSYFYLPRDGGQVIELMASGHTKLNFLNLAPLGWWCTAFSKGSSFDAERAADSLISACFKNGVFDSDRIRGRGAWFDANRVILHLGNRLSVIEENGVHALHQIDAPPPSYYFYEHSKCLTGPAEDPLDDESALELLNIAKHFRWDIPASAYFLLGWTVLAPVCGALDWRPHVWITGGAGTGKTTILKHFMRPLLGGIYQAATGGTTEAGLRGTLKSDAIPVVFDEFEQNEQRDKQIVQNILSLARIASSEGGKIYKGTTSGGANSFEIRSMFCVSSINVNLIQKADIDRFCVLGLRRDPISKDDWTDFEQRILNVATLQNGRRLIARTVINIPTIRANARIIASALAMEFGQRYGDQYGTLLAGAWSLSPGGGDLLTLKDAQQWIQSMNWELQSSDPSEADEIKCLNFILNAMVLVDSRKITMRELIGMARRGVMSVTPMRDGSDDPAVVLARYGLKIHEGQLAIANSHSNLQALLKDTPWSGNAYRQSLRRVPNAQPSPSPIRFPGMGSVRCTLLPIDILD